MTSTDLDLAGPADGTDELAGLNYVETIETVISGLDQFDNALVSHGDQGHIWKFKYGSVDVFVQLTGSTDEDSLTIWSAVLSLPVQNESGLYRRLLELNWLTTLEAHFALFNNQVVVLATRTLAELSAGEISRGITIVATIADEYDDVLKAEFASN